MKVLLFDTEFKLTHQVENVKVIKEEENLVEWEDGSFSGIKGYYMVVEDTDTKEYSPKEILTYRHRITLEKEKEKVSERIYAGFNCPLTGHKYEYKETDQANMNAAVNKLLINPLQLSVLWMTEDAGEVEHSRDSFFTLFEEAEKFKVKCIEDYRAFKDSLLEQEPSPVAVPPVNESNPFPKEPLVKSIEFDTSLPPEKLIPEADHPESNK